MTRKRVQLLESLKGLGEVYKDEKNIASVHYTISVSQEMLIINNTQEVPGIKRIDGEVAVFEGQRNLIDGNEMTLLLDDGRKWKFLAKSGNPVSGVYRVINASGEGLTM
jgi:hypothetical protein